MPYLVDDLQAVEPDALAKVEGVTVRVSDEFDSMGFNRVEVEADTREALLDYVAREWGVKDSSGEIVGDIDWFNEWVRDRVTETPR